MRTLLFAFIALRYNLPWTSSGTFRDYVASARAIPAWPADGGCERDLEPGHKHPCASVACPMPVIPKAFPL
jgi:hypothetical protein